MSRIDDLIAEHCPDGVEYVKLNNLGQYIRGVTYTKHDESETGSIPVFRSNNIDQNKNVLILSAVKLVVSSVKVRDEQWLKGGDILISAASGSKEHVGKMAYIFEPIDATYGAFMSVIRVREGILPRFLFHILTGSEFKGYIRATLASSTINNLNKSIVGNFSVPVPPICVQEEIVRILDKFTQLEAELEARRRQYRHYRDDLLVLTEGRGVKLLALSEVGLFIRGNGLQKKDLLESGLPAVHYGQIHTKYGVWFDQPLSYVEDLLFSKLRKADPGDLIIATTSEDSEAVGKAAAWVGDEPIAVSGDSFIFRHSLNPKYVSYFFQSNHFHQQKKRLVTGTKVRRISASDLGKIKIPVFAREEQDRIVSALDCFNDLVTDISIGLPAELQARRKQYEYYRDKLLTFKEKA